MLPSSLAGASAVHPRTRPGVALAMLTFIVVLNAVDRQLVAVLAEPIKRDLGLTDSELGLLSGFVFALFYTFFGIPIAWLSDRVNRVRLVTTACALWSVFSALCGFANNFLQIALARIGVAVGEAGGSPPSYSIISDYFPAAQRGTALAVFSIGIPIGMALAVAAGGFVAASYGWRSAFLAVCVPGLTASALLLLLVEEPQRGRLDGNARELGPTPPLMQIVIAFIRDPVLMGIGIAASLSVFASHGVIAWLPAFLVRTKGMSLTEMAAYYSLVSGAGMAVGALIAGKLADVFVMRGRHYVPLIPAVANMLAWPFILLAVSSNSWQSALACVFVPMVAFWTYLPVALMLIQNSVAANQRATCSSLLLFMVGIIGIGGGATYVGAVSDIAARRFELDSLQVGLIALVPVFLCAVGAHVWTARQIFRRDHMTLRGVAQPGVTSGEGTS